MISPRFAYRSWRRSFDLTCVKPPRLPGPRARLPLFTCLRNERFRLPSFLEYYRRLGVDQFYIIDNDSTDGLMDLLGNEADCAVWQTKASYKASNFGMDWCNYLLKRYGAGGWIVCVDPDEYLVYPKIETRSLRDLTDYMDDVDQPSLFTVMIDAYSDRPVEDTTLGEGDDPFRACPYFDRFNFTQSFDATGQHCWVQGGVRQRAVFNNDPKIAPALNKVPLIRWQSHYKYISSMHHTNVGLVNCNLNESPAHVSGCLFHFKYVSALKDKADEEMQRKQHFGDSKEYVRYRDSVGLNFYDPAISVRYESSAQLEDLRFMQRGDWF